MNLLIVPANDRYRVVCAASKQTSKTVHLTSYKSPYSGDDVLDSVKIWEACCATLAVSSLFDPITIEQYNQEFVNGATEASNPVWEVWNQAQLIWGPEPLDSKVKCLVSIGAGVHLPSGSKTDMLSIGKVLIAIATESEYTAQRFRLGQSHLDHTSRYYRFNMVSGLEEIGLEDLSKKQNIAEATQI